jgi:hypothetical protein
MINRNNSGVKGQTLLRAIWHTLKCVFTLSLLTVRNVILLDNVDMVHSVPELPTDGLNGYPVFEDISYRFKVKLKMPNVVSEWNKCGLSRDNRIIARIFE